MHFDFEFILVSLALVSGIIWLFDLIFLTRRRKAKQVANDQPLKDPITVDYAKSFFPVILIVILIRSFLAEPFRIPSSSMMPTLLIGDFILVNKFAYGIRLPVIHTKLFPVALPDYGDVVVFRFPHNPKVDYIKRVVGLPGDKISYKNKMLYINDKPINQDYIESYKGVGAGENMSGAELKTEHLYGADHQILLKPNSFYDAGEGTWQVPEEHYFVLGDNRDRSADSRFWRNPNNPNDMYRHFVPEKNLVGKAEWVWMNWDASNGGIGFERMGTKIQ